MAKQPCKKCREARQAALDALKQRQVRRAMQIAADAIKENGKK